MQSQRGPCRGISDVAVSFTSRYLSIIVMLTTMIIMVIGIIIAIIIIIMVWSLHQQARA